MYFTKYYIYLVYLLLLSSCQSESKNAQLNTSNLTGTQLDSIGYKYYSKDHDKASEAFLAAGQFHSKNKNHQAAAQSYLNLANLYDEGIEDQVTALKYAEVSLKHWQSISKPLQIANLKKYVGMLKGLTGNPKEGIKDIDEAVRIFASLNNKSGIAVSKFDLALVYEKTENYEMAIKLYEECVNYWTDFNNYGRVFSNHLLGLRLYHKTKDIDKLNALVEECERIRSNLKVNQYVDQRYVKTLRMIKESNE